MAWAGECGEAFLDVKLRGARVSSGSARLLVARLRCPFCFMRFVLFGLGRLTSGGSGSIRMLGARWGFAIGKLGEVISNQ